ncbi:hypothetical protein GW796_09535 [archaeon]|nr:hypothetical protein [archaeon]
MKYKVVALVLMSVLTSSVFAEYNVVVEYNIKKKNHEERKNSLIIKQQQKSLEDKKLESKRVLEAKNLARQKEEKFKSMSKEDQAATIVMSNSPTTSK